MRVARLAAGAPSKTLTAMGLLAMCAPLASASVERPSNPLRFWEGRTESTGVIKLIMHKPFSSRAEGFGQIRPDLNLECVRSALMGAIEGLLRDQLLSELVGFPARYKDKDVQMMFETILASFTPPH